MKDYFGQTLELGDKVAFCRPQYRDLVTGTIIAFTPKQVRVEYKTYGSSMDTYLGLPNFFIKRP